MQVKSIKEIIRSDEAGYIGSKMLEIRKSAIGLDEKELLELERITTDGDEKEALKFLKKVIYNKIIHSQQGRLKSHLDTGGDPIEKFKGQLK